MHKECFTEDGWRVLKALKGLLAKYDAILAGGTALALRIGHRVSRDLDFFTGKDFRVEAFISGIRKTGLPFSVISEGEGSLVVEIAGIKFSLFRYEYPFMEKPLLFEDIRIAGILDIASMKVIAMSQRGTKRDFVDLFFVLHKLPFHLVAGHMVKRFGRERINPIHVGKSFVYFTDAETDPEPDYIKGRGVAWEKIKGFFKAHVRQFVLDLEAAAGSGR